MKTYPKDYPRESFVRLKEIYKDQPIDCAEIGVLYGEHAATILSLMNIRNLWLIDCWAPYTESQYTYDQTNWTLIEKEVRERFSASPNVTVIKSFSEPASLQFLDYSLDCVYLDATHYYNQVANDLRCWYPKIKSGGWLLGHDWNSPGVSQAVTEKAAEAQSSVVISANETEWWFRKN